MPQAVCPVIVSFHSPSWIQVALRSLHEHFPHWRVLVVDNNPQPGEDGYQSEVAAERSWLHTQTYVDVVVQPDRTRTHGKGIDLAVAWCREHGIPWMLHLEPDCLVSGAEWYARLCGGIDRGALMSASHRKKYGPLHVTPSLWAVTETLPASMDYAKRRPDESHPRFAELFNLPWLLQEVPSWIRSFWETTWDTGQKAWFDLAVHDQAAQVEETRDFQHYWQGSSNPPQREWLQARPELWRYLDPQYREPQRMPERPVTPAASALRSLLLQNLAPFRGQRAALLGLPHHANTGDHLITLGTRAALQAAGVTDVDEQSGTDIDLERCRAADVVFFAGGGNFGDIYRHEMESRLACSEKLTQPVIWLPQSVYYQDSRCRADDAARLAACPHVELWIRDAESLAIAMQAFANRVRLVPDMAFGLETVPLFADPAGPIVRIQRQDAETVEPGGMRGIDWMLPGTTLPHDPSEFWPQAWRCLPRPSKVLTDCLHVHVLCVLADIPNVLVTGGHHKMSAFYRTWSHWHPGSRLVHDWNEAEQIAAQ